MQHLCYKQGSDSGSKRSLCRSHFTITLSSTNSLDKGDIIARVTYLRVKLLLGSSSSALSKSDRAPCRSPSFRFTSPRTLQKEIQNSVPRNFLQWQQGHVLKFQWCSTIRYITTCTPHLARKGVLQCFFDLALRS